MTISERIELDVACLKEYFRKLFSMAESVPPFEGAPQIGDEYPELFTNHSVAAFVRPDMACNIYSLVDFWLAELCRFHKQNGSLTIAHKDIKGSSDLDAYHKYLTMVALLDLQVALPSLNHLHYLRKVRNFLIHGGGHVQKERHAEINNISGVSIHGSLLLINDAFVWDSLDHARTYLCAVANSRSASGGFRA